jgi:hypothetical protein
LIDFSSNKGEEQDLCLVLLYLKVFESVSKKLQEKGIDLLVQQKKFDALTSRYPQTMKFLGPASCAAHSPMFEFGNFILPLLGSTNM